MNREQAKKLVNFIDELIGVKVNDAISYAQHCNQGSGDSWYGDSFLKKDILRDKMTNFLLGKNEDYIDEDEDYIDEDEDV